MSLLPIDTLLKSHLDLLVNQRVALLAHPSSVDSNYQHLLDRLLAVPQIKIVRLFGPEHGFDGQAQDMVGVTDQVHSRTGIPMISLYGHSFDSLKPSPQHLADIDILVCDLQDVGSRYYTFIYTMALCMQACGQLGKKMVVLDRPNPINGQDIEGHILKKGFESFVGLYAGMPVRHGMTLGELAQYFNQEQGFHCDLTVIGMPSWKRHFYYDESGFPWVLPSPNMPTLETALLYPGLCLIEATHLSEGRGTTKPFEFVGAPYIDPYHLASTLQKNHHPGVIFRPITFRPSFHKFAGQDCGGVQIHILNRKELKPFLMGVDLIKTIHDLYPHEFEWRAKPYEFVDQIPAMDLLTGDASIRNQIEKGIPLNKMTQSWNEGLDTFLNKRKNYLLYPEV